MEVVGDVFPQPKAFGDASRTYYELLRVKFSIVKGVQDFKTCKFKP